MALKKSQSLDVIGLNVETEIYANIASVNVMKRADGTCTVSAVLNVYANEQARRDGKNPVGVANVQGLYIPDTTENIFSVVYALAKKRPEFADAKDA